MTVKPNDQNVSPAARYHVAAITRSGGRSGTLAGRVKNLGSNHLKATSGDDVGEAAPRAAVATCPSRPRVTRVRMPQRTRRKWCKSIWARGQHMPRPVPLHFCLTNSPGGTPSTAIGHDPRLAKRLVTKGEIPPPTYVDRTLPASSLWPPDGARMLSATCVAEIGRSMDRGRDRANG
jgi:hypothetical protein